MSYQSINQSRRLASKASDPIQSNPVRSGLLLLRSSGSSALTTGVGVGTGPLLAGVVAVAAVEHAALRLVEAGEQKVDLLLQAVETRLEGLGCFLTPGVVTGLWLAGGGLRTGQGGRGEGGAK
jgi:hypothetical protein